MKTKIIFSAIVVLLLFAGGAGAQVILTAQEAVLSEQDKAFFDRHIRNQNYAVFTLDTSELLDSLRTHRYCNVQLYINEQWNWEFYLVPNYMGPNIDNAFRGRTSDNETISLIIDDNYFSGYVNTNQGDVGIVYTREFTQNFTDKSLIVFKVSDLFEIGIDDIGCSQLSVYPNPTSNILNIDYKTLTERDGLNISILDVQGKVMKVFQTFESNITLSLEELDSGIYFVQVTASDSGKSITKPIVVQK